MNFLPTLASKSFAANHRLSDVIYRWYILRIVYLDIPFNPSNLQSNCSNIDSL